MTKFSENKILPRTLNGIPMTTDKRYMIKALNKEDGTLAISMRNLDAETAMGVMMGSKFLFQVELELEQVDCDCTSEQIPEPKPTPIKDYKNSRASGFNKIEVNLSLFRVIIAVLGVAWMLRELGWV